jgi:nucleotide-binding universal stress UspA family protein
VAADIRQILVHLDPTKGAARRLGTACELARGLQASLTALYATTPAFAELPYAPTIGGTGMSAALLQRDERRRQQAFKVFEETRRASGLEVAWAQTGQVPIADAFAQQALFADLLVLGQADPTDDDATAVPADFPESVLLACGRPALLVPHIGAPRTIGRTVAIAWKETPQAARAVTAALPFLRKAARVHVLSWGEEPSPGVAGQSLDLAKYLAAHGIAFSWDRAGAERQQIGELLLSRAFDFGADLLVMGCYGQSRAREWILGGASRTILQSMTLPVLMMH